MLKKAASAAYQSMNNGFKTRGSQAGGINSAFVRESLLLLEGSYLDSTNDLGELDVQTRVDYIASYHQNSGKVLQILTSLKDVIDIENGGEVACSLKKHTKFWRKSFGGVKDKK